MSELAPTLRPIQRAVLSGIMRGDSNKEIARTLRLSPKTVNNACHALFLTLGARNRTDAAVTAWRLGLHPLYDDYRRRTPRAV